MYSSIVDSTPRINSGSMKCFDDPASAFLDKGGRHIAKLNPMPGGVLFSSSSPVDLLSTSPLQVHLSQPVTLSLSAMNFSYFVFLLSAEELRLSFIW